MDIFFNSGTQWIIFLQSLGGWLSLPMKAFSFLGSEDFFMLVLPILYWSIDSALGVRVGIILLVGSSLNTAFKLVFHTPRPYWYSTQVRGLSAEPSFGLPSNHSQTAFGVWGMLVSQGKRRWAWILAGLIIFFIGLSRVYLGVHFPIDVVVGWLFGALTLWLVLKLWSPTVTWLKKMQLGTQILMVFLASLVLIGLALGATWWLKISNWQMPASWLVIASRDFPGGEPINPTSLAGIFTTTGTLFGLGGGLAWLNMRGGFNTNGSLVQRILRYILGLVGLLAIRYGLKAIFPEGETWLGLVFQYIRYAVIGFWVSAGAPMCFFWLKLAKKNP